MFFSLFLLFGGFVHNVFAQLLIPLQPAQVPVNTNSTYRAKRTPEDEKDTILQRRFVVEKLSIEQTTEIVTIVVTFNIPANPITLTKESVSINNESLPETSYVKFNKAGTEWHILIPIEDLNIVTAAEDQDLYVVISDITAYEGAILDERKIDKFEFTISYRYAQ